MYTHIFIHKYLNTNNNIYIYTDYIHNLDLILKILGLNYEYNQKYSSSGN